MNKVFLIGRLTAEPKVTSTEKGVTIARYTLAVDRRIAKGATGESTDFISCIAFNKSADFAERYLRKGTKIAVEGRIQTGKYTNKNGETVYTTDIVIDSQEFCESKKATEQADNDKVDVIEVPDSMLEELPFN